VRLVERRVVMARARWWGRFVEGEVEEDAGVRDKEVRGFVRSERGSEKFVRREVRSEIKSPSNGALKPPGLRARVARCDCRVAPVEPLYFLVSILKYFVFDFEQWCCGVKNTEGIL
jgi:hypothetical protein